MQHLDIQNGTDGSRSTAPSSCYLPGSKRGSRSTRKTSCRKPSSSVGVARPSAHHRLPGWFLQPSADALSTWVEARIGGRGGKQQRHGSLLKVGLIQDWRSENAIN